MCLSGQPALKVRLAASNKRDGNEWAWVVNGARVRLLSDRWDFRKR